MKVRHITLLTAITVEIILFFYCLLKKSNHVPAGYICAVLSLILLICTGWLLLFPKVTTLETTGKYQVNHEDCFYTDTSQLETYADDGSFGVKNSNETLYRELAADSPQDQPEQSLSHFK